MEIESTATNSNVRNPVIIRGLVDERPLAAFNQKFKGNKAQIEEEKEEDKPQAVVTQDFSLFKYMLYTILLGIGTFFGYTLLTKVYRYFKPKDAVTSYIDDIAGGNAVPEYAKEAAQLLKNMKK